MVLLSSYCTHRLNEGITTYLERKIVARLHGEQERHLHAMGECSVSPVQWTGYKLLKA